MDDDSSEATAKPKRDLFDFGDGLTPRRRAGERKDGDGNPTAKPARHVAAVDDDSSEATVKPRRPSAKPTRPEGPGAGSEILSDAELALERVYYRTWKVEHEETVTIKGSLNRATCPEKGGKCALEFS